MKPPPPPSPGRADKQLPAPGLARLLRNSSRRRSRRVALLPAAFVSRSRSADAAVGEPSSPKVTCIGQVRMRNSRGNKKGKGKCSASPETKEYFRCLMKVFFCGWPFGFARKRPNAPSPEAGTKKDHQVEVTAAKAKIARKLGNFGQVDFMSPAPPPKNALLLTRCRSAPQNRASPLTSRFPVVAPSSAKDAKKRQEVAIVKGQEMRCPSARTTLVLRRCKSESATMATAKMATAVAEATSRCFWANGRKNHMATTNR